MKSKEIKKQLRLDEEPDAELMALLDGIEDRPARIHPSAQKMLETATSQSIQGSLEDELLVESVGALITQARKKRGLTLEQVGRMLDVGKARMSQIEKQDANLELQTLARVASVMNYELKIVFQPKQG
jgi:ribosome-binding protein aMBF1 (putative translation factor)